MDKLAEPPLHEHMEMFRRFSVDLFKEVDLELSESRKREFTPEEEGITSTLGFSDDNQKKRRRLLVDETEPARSDASDLEEEFGSEGVTGVVERFLSDKTGEILVRERRPVKVLFHADQVWTGGDSGEGYSPFMELYPSTELPFFIKVGEEVRLNARRVTGCKYDFQATLVWRGDEVPPCSYRTPELTKKLNFTLTQHLFLETGDARHRVNPLLGTLDYALPGRVAEYLSFEAGVVKLEEASGAFVLFHLNQVWTGGDEAVPLSSVINRQLSECLPVGSSVMVNMRPIAASLGSKLTHQATCVWPFLCDGPQSSCLPPQYIQRYTPWHHRTSLVQELDSHHDNLKTVLRLHTSPFSTEFLPIQAILMGLPNFWQAQVVAGINEDFGLIRVSPKRGGELAARVKSLLVMFHIEDVFDVNGLPAIQSSEVNMESIMDKFVDLTARSICFDSEPESLLDLQQRLDRENKGESVPLLQAVNVCIKLHPEADCAIRNVPKPTPLRNHPGNFSMGTTSFYLNPTLKLRLNKKLSKYFFIINKQPPFKTRLKDFFDDEEEIKTIEEVRKLDKNNVGRFVYGEFPSNVEPTPADLTKNLPRIIEKIGVKLVYLHRTKLQSDWGIVELCLQPSRLNTLKEPNYFLALFSLSCYRFFMAKDCFAEDLANMMPVNSCEEYNANVELVFPGSKVPFLVLDIWNENLRKDMNAQTPSSGSVIDDKEFIEESAKKISQLTNMSLEIVMRSHKRELTNRERSHHGEVTTTERSHKGEVTTRERRHKGEVIMEDFDDEPRDRRRRYSGARREPDDTPDRRARREASNVKDDPCFKLENYNPTHIANSHFENAKYFIMRSLNHEDILVSIKHKIWTSKEQINGKLNQAFKENRGKGPVYLLFSVIGSKQFCGIAEMTSFVDFKRRSNVWKSFKSKIRGNFRVNWIYLKDVPNTKLNHITLENNEDKPITFTKDGHDVPPVQGEETVRLIHDFESSSSILDDLERIQNLFGKSEDQGGDDQRRRPRPIRSNQILFRDFVWKDILHDHYGRVLKIMGNYGLAVSFVVHNTGKGRGSVRQFTPFQLLFDVYDVFLDDLDCGELGKPLEQVMEVGDFVRFNGVRLESVSQQRERDIRHLATSLVVAKTPEDLKKLKYPADIEQIFSLNQISKDKIENFKAVVKIMNEKRLRKIEKDFLDQAKDGTFAANVLNLPKENLRQEREAVVATTIRNGPSQEEIEEMKSYEALIKEKVLQKAKERRNTKEIGNETPSINKPTAAIEDSSNSDTHEKREDVAERSASVEVEEKGVVDIEKLSQELKPKELRKLIMAYIGAISILPENPEQRKVEVAEVIKKINSEKEIEFFENFFISLGQQCVKAEKGIKVGHVFVTQMQVRSIRGRGILCRADILKEDQSDGKDSCEENERKNQCQPSVTENHSKKDNSEKNNGDENDIEVLPCTEDDDVVSKKDSFCDIKSVNQDDDIVAIDEISENKLSDVQEDPSDGTEQIGTEETVHLSQISNMISESSEDENSLIKNPERIEIVSEDRDISVEKITESPATCKVNLSNYTSSALRTFLRHFIKLTDDASGRTIADVGQECQIPLEEVKSIASQVTDQCKLVKVVDGKPQGIKLNNIFVNASWVQKIVNLNYH